MNNYSNSKYLIIIKFEIQNNIDKLWKSKMHQT